MSKNNVHNFGKLFFKVKVAIVKHISRFNHPLYMKLYVRILKSQGMDIQGMPIYIGASASFDGKDYGKIHLGDKAVISSDVRFLTHDYSISRAIEATGRHLDKEVYFIKDIYVGENCFIGAKAILMPGTRLGKNVIVGGGAVVRGSVPDDSMVIGNPAFVIGNTLEWAENKLSEKAFCENKN